MLLDAFGQPVDLGQLKREHAAPSLTSVRQVISDHPSTGLTPQRLARLLRASEAGDATAYLELAEDMEEKDLDYRSLLQTRKLACAGLELVVEAASDAAEAKKDANLVREVLANLDMEEHLVDLLDALGKGYSAMEIQWDTEGKAWTPTDLVWRDPRWFQMEVNDQSTLLLRDGAMGQGLAPYKWITHKPKLKSGLPLRGGLARAAAWAFLFSNYALKDWVAFAEVFGMPLRIGRYPAGTGEDQIAILKQAVAEIGSDAGAVIPDAMQLEIKESSGKAASSDLYEKLLRYLDERKALAILGQTLTSGQSSGGGGSYALGKIHERVRQDIKRADARQSAATLGRDLVRPIVDLNHGPRKAYPKIRLHIAEPVDLTEKAKQLEILVPLGLKVEQSVVRDQFGYPDPPKGQDVELLAPPSPQSPVPATPTGPEDLAQAAQSRQPCGCCGHLSAAQAQGDSKPGQGSPGPARGSNDNDNADLLVDQLERETTQAMAALLEPVKRLVLGAQSFQEITDGLLELYPEMATGDFASLVAEAMTAAHLAGRFDVAQATRR